MSLWVIEERNYMLASMDAQYRMEIVQNSLFVNASADMIACCACKLFSS